MCGWIWWNVKWKNLFKCKKKMFLNMIREKFEENWYCFFKIMKWKNYFNFSSLETSFWYFVIDVAA